jgi:undecaprenyl diphosphate synthase
MRGMIQPTSEQPAGQDAAALLEQIHEGPVPAHVAVIMDGNGRWARQRGLPRWEGHRAGMSSVREVIEGAAAARVQHLTLYAFSKENWARPKAEVAALMGLLEEYIAREKEELIQSRIRVSVFGDLSRLPRSARRAIADLEESTRTGDALWVHLAISYGSRSEIVEACRALATQCRDGALSPEEITEDRLAAELLTRAWPDPDLLIRTSGEQRISNFLLWQIAYAEIFVTPVLWPDFKREHLFAALLEYRGRDRRFGRVRSGT